MRVIFTERNLVIILFILVLVTFSLAQEDSRKITAIRQGVLSSGSNLFQQKHTPIAAGISSDNNPPVLPAE